MKSERKYKVYRYTSPSGKVYIGLTCRTLGDRAKGGSGYKGCHVFLNAIKKYGLENFKIEIVSDNLTYDEANWLEQYMIAYHNSFNRKYGYNLTKGGGGSLGFYSAERNAKISKTRMGHPVSEETRRLLSIKNTGKKQSSEAIEKTASAHRGRKRSEETKRKLRAGVKAFYASERGKEVAKARAEKMYAKTIIDENGNIYPTYKKAADALGIEQSTLRVAILEGRPAKGHMCRLL